MAARLADVIPLRPAEESAPRPAIVAVVLSDGTVRRIGEEGRHDGDWSSGQLTGRDWILWWERRAFSPER